MKVHDVDFGGVFIQSGRKYLKNNHVVHDDEDGVMHEAVHFGTGATWLFGESEECEEVCEEDDDNEDGDKIEPGVYFATYSCNDPQEDDKRYPVQVHDDGTITDLSTGCDEDNIDDWTDFRMAVDPEGEPC